MAGIPEDKFIMTDEKYQSGVAVDEYAGKISIVNARQGKDGNVYSEWAYPQKRVDGENVPGQKALPWKILLGGSQAEAISILKKLLIMVGDVQTEETYNSVPVTDDKDSDSTIPF